MAIKVTGLVKDNPPKSKPAITMTVDFGEGFAAKTMTRGEFIQQLRTHSHKWTHNFLGEMFNHYADHIEAAAALGGEHALDKPANLHILNTYYGEGSCSGCSLSHPGGSCCRCDHDDVSSCEPCG